MGHTGLTRARCGAQERAADEAKIRAQCQSLQHVGAAAKAAVHDHRHLVARGFADAGQHAQRRHGAVQLPSAVVGDHHAVQAVLARDAHGVFVDHAFDQQVAFPDFAHMGDVFPRQAVAPAVVAAAAGGEHRHARPHVFHVRHTVFEQCFEEHAEQPLRPVCNVPCETQRGAQRRAVAVAHVVLAVGGHLHVDGDSDGVEAGFLAALEGFADALFVARQIGLEHRGAACGFDVFHAHEGRAAHHHRNVGLCRHAGEHGVAAITRGGGAAHRRKAERCVIRFAEQRGLHAALGGVDQGFGHEADFIEHVTVAAQRGVVFHAAGDITVNRPR